MEISAYALVFRYEISAHRVTHHPSVLVFTNWYNCPTRLIKLFWCIVDCFARGYMEFISNL